MKRFRFHLIPGILQRSCVIEGLLIFLLILLINNFLGNPERPIRSDGQGYYEYLPSLFIHDDLNRHELDTVPARLDSLAMYVDFEGQVLNKYPAGTAFLMSPFFALGHLAALSSDAMLTGYSQPYQKAMFYAVLFYLFLALFFLRKWLATYDYSWLTIAVIQLLVVFATSILNYVAFEPTFSHIYSLFAISAFLTFTSKYLSSLKTSDFIWASVFFGLLVMIRQVNLIVLVFLPFLAGDKLTLSGGVQNIVAKPKILLTGIIIAFSFSLIQMMLWKLQVDRWVVFSYQGETFDFLDPKFIDILFSYRKGLYVYTPVAFLSLFGLFFWLKDRLFFKAIAWLGGVVFVVYVLSSWWSWEYGCSFGNRAFIDFYGLLLLPLATLLERLKRFWKLAVLIPGSFFIYLAVIQSYQFKKFIMDWYLMDSQKYWDIFLETDERFRGIYFKPHYPLYPPDAHLLKTVTMKDTVLAQSTKHDLLLLSSNKINDFKALNMVHIEFNSEFQSAQKAELELTFEPMVDGEPHFYRHFYVLRFREGDLGSYHLGAMPVPIPDYITRHPNQIKLSIETEDKDLIIDDFTLRFYHFKPVHESLE